MEKPKILKKNHGNTKNLKQKSLKTRITRVTPASVLLRRTIVQLIQCELIIGYMTENKQISFGTNVIVSSFKIKIKNFLQLHFTLN